MTEEQVLSFNRPQGVGAACRRCGVFVPRRRHTRLDRRSSPGVGKLTVQSAELARSLGVRCLYPRDLPQKSP